MRESKKVIFTPKRKIKENKKQTIKKNLKEELSYGEIAEINTIAQEYIDELGIEKCLDNQEILNEFIKDLKGAGYEGQELEDASLAFQIYIQDVAENGSGRDHKANKEIEEILRKHFKGEYFSWEATGSELTDDGEFVTTGTIYFPERKDVYPQPLHAWTEKDGTVVSLEYTVLDDDGEEVEIIKVFDDGGMINESKKPVRESKNTKIGEIFDILGIEEDNRDKKPYLDLIPQYKKLESEHPTASIWLEDDEPYYDGLGHIIAKTRDLVAIEEDEYKVEYWLDEEAREEGLGEYHTKTFESLQEAKTLCKKLVNKNGMASAEVTNQDGDVVFGYDGVNTWTE